MTLRYLQPLDIDLRRLVRVVDDHFLHYTIRLKQRTHTPILLLHNYPSATTTATHCCR